MVPQPPPILPSTGTDSTTENRPTMTLADLEAAMAIVRTRYSQSDRNDVQIEVFASLHAI